MRTRRDIALVDMLAPDQANATGNHDRLVIATQLTPIDAVDELFKSTKVTAGVGAPEFVVERRGADRTIDHDIERRGDAARFAIVLFPGLFEPGNSQVRHRETTQPRLGLRADAGCTLVANFSTGTRRRTRKRRYRGRVIVRLDFHQDIELGIVVAILRVQR